ncbi:hypothetical protein ABH908_000526 [Pseudomonas frederiksbergensis]|uniref:hypothetical protein n=1 Tax=Pseudomonas TaxID=286 RepID=UPI003D1CE5A2
MQLRSVALEFRELEHQHFGKPDVEFSVASLSLDSWTTYEMALNSGSQALMVKATVDAVYCGELSFWTDTPIPQLLGSQSVLAEAWIKGWERGEQINLAHVVTPDQASVARWQAV